MFTRRTGWARHTVGAHKPLNGASGAPLPRDRDYFPRRTHPALRSASPAPRLRTSARPAAPLPLGAPRPFTSKPRLSPSGLSPCVLPQGLLPFRLCCVLLRPVPQLLALTSASPAKPSTPEDKGQSARLILLSPTERRPLEKNLRNGANSHANFLSQAACPFAISVLEYRLCGRWP